MKRIWIFAQDDQTQAKLNSGLEHFGLNCHPDLLRVINLKGEEEELPLSAIPSSLMTRIELSIHGGSHWAIRKFFRMGDEGPTKEEKIIRYHATTVRKTKKAIAKACQRKKR